MKKQNAMKEAIKTPEHIRMPRVISIEKVVRENPSTKTFFFNHPEISKLAEPGQYVMLGVYANLNEPDSAEEIPLSLSYIDPENGIIGVTVKEVGETTKALLRHKAQDYLTLRGPYGRGFKIEGSNIAVIAGGIGVSPLAPLVEELKKKNVDVTVFIGAKTSFDLIFVNRIKKTGTTVVLTTEDGSIGDRGMITDAFNKSVTFVKYDHVMTAGKEKMLEKILDITEKYDISAQLSLERHIKCGRGVCGHCAIDGHLVCKDGPVFSSEDVRKMKDFGKNKLDESGAVSNLS